MTFGITIVIDELSIMIGDTKSLIPYDRSQIFYTIAWEMGGHHNLDPNVVVIPIAKMTTL